VTATLGARIGFIIAQTSATPCQYVSPHAKQTEVNDILNDMKAKAAMEESDSSWVSPVVLDQKMNGDLRYCVDYRKLNDVNEKDFFQLPRFDDTLDTLQGLNSSRHLI
jgi:hypothetical protein